MGLRPCGPLNRYSTRDMNKQRRRLPRFVYLMSAPAADEEGKRVPSIGCARNPFVRVRAQNRIKGYPGGSKGTRAGAPHWTLDLIIGPFYRGSNAFKNSWRKKSRKMTCRLVHGLMKAHTYASRGLRIWARDLTAIHAKLSDVHYRKIKTVLKQCSNETLELETRDVRAPTVPLTPLVPAQVPLKPWPVEHIWHPERYQQNIY